MEIGSEPSVGGLCLSLALASRRDAQRSRRERAAPATGCFPRSATAATTSQHYDLTINYDPAANTMVSTADITLRATQDLSEFSLDLRGFTVTAVTIDGVAGDVHRAAGDKLIVTPAAGIANGRVVPHRRPLQRHAGGRSRTRTSSFEGWAADHRRRLRGQRADGRDGLVPEQQPPVRQGDLRLPHHRPDTHTALGNGELVVQGRQRRRHDDVELAHGLPDGDAT